MCKGLALGIHKDTLKIECKGLSRHSETFNNEDDYLKFEIIITDKNEKGYRLQLDDDYSNDSYVRKKFKSLLTKSNKPKKEVLKLVNNWIIENENQVLRWLLFNQTYKEVEGNCDNSFQKIEGNCDNSYQKVQGNCYNYSQQVKGDCYNYYQKVQCNCDNSFQKVKGNCYNYSQQVKGNCYNYSQQVKGDCYNSYQKVQGDCDNSYQEVQGEIYVNNVMNYKPKIDKFIKKLTEENGSKLTWEILVKLAMKGYGK